MDRGRLLTETFGYDGGRDVTTYVPPEPPETIVFAGDGQVIAPWCWDLAKAGLRSTAVVAIHRHADEKLRLREYSAGFDPERFAAHERFVIDDVRRWAEIELEMSFSAERTAVFGVSASAELALALGLRHPDVFGSVLCASPGAGYRPPMPLPHRLPRTYLVAGRQEPFFLDNTTRWATALRTAGADVVMEERDGTHGGAFWRREFPPMITWAFEPSEAT